MIKKALSLPVLLTVLAVILLSFSDANQPYLTTFLIVLLVGWWFLNKDLKLDKINKITFRKNKYLIIILLAIFLLAVILRVWKAGFLSPTRDEFGHLIAAKRWLTEGNLRYLRGWETTYLVAFLFKIFNSVSVTVARLVPVFFGSITTFFIYLLGKKIRKEVGLIAAFLWAVSPFAIGLARYVREYSLYVLIVTLFMVLLMNFLDDLRNQQFTKKTIAEVVVIVAMLAFSFLPGVSRGYNIVFVLALITIFFYLIPVIRKIHNKNPYYLLIIPLVILAVVLPLVFAFKKLLFLSPSDLMIKYSSGPFLTFFDSIISGKSWVASQWYSGVKLLGWWWILVFLSGFISFYRNRAFVLFNIIFWAGYGFFTLFYAAITQISFGSRMLFFLLPFFIIIIATSVYFLF
ncbi:unnamed protein product, partial [marine sediment metagenome]